MVDLAFQPNQLAIAVNADVVIRLGNKGMLGYGFVIDKPKIDSGLIDGGAEGSVTVNFPAGTYKFYCSVEGHAAAGMDGQLTVQ